MKSIGDCHALWAQHPEAFASVLEFAKKQLVFAVGELDIYETMGNFNSAGNCTVECNGILYTNRNGKPFGIVAAGNFMDKRLHWYDPEY